MKRRFLTLDVFTDRRFAGNPLAVVLESAGLDGAAMQAIAREFNLSETVFVLPPRAAAHRARLRIFTPGRELPFAGHPIVGSAVLLGILDGGVAGRQMVLEAGLGNVSCQVTARDDAGKASFALPALPASVGTPPSAQTLAGALGLAPEDIGFDGFVQSCWSAGMAFTFVPLKDLNAVRRARLDLTLYDVTLSAPEHSALYLFTAETAEPGHDFHARMFAPAAGVMEDPATGSAAAAFTGVLSHGARLAAGRHNVSIEQGHEMGRPSLIRLALTVADGALRAGSVGGDAVVVIEGAIEA